MQRQSHIIQQQHIDIQFEEFFDGVGIQNEISDLFYEKLFPEMASLFDEMAGEKKIVSIENMAIDCGLLTRQNWKQELVEQTLRQLRHELSIADKKEITNYSMAALASFESLLFFLENGHLPWNTHIHSIKELEKEILKELIREESLAEKKFYEPLKKLFQTKSSATERLVSGFSDFFVCTVLEQLAGSKKDRLAKIYSHLNYEEPLAKIDFFSIKKETGRSKKQDVLLTLLRVFANDPVDPEEQFYSYLSVNNEGVENRESEAQAQGNKERQANEVTLNETKKDSNEHIYIHNAGLIILHPFLRELFTRLELINKNEWKDEVSQNMAVSVLEFLVLGKEDFAEFNLPLNKILCGLNMYNVLHVVEELPSFIISECDNLLDEVIIHWSVLKNTSRDGLRETFLQRSGMLTRVDNGWLLRVEQKGVDILLNSLPWGIGTIKLPWTADWLHVEWI